MTNPFKKEQDYCILVNSKELYDAAERNGFQDILLIVGEKLSQTSLLKIKAQWNAACIIFYTDNSDKSKSEAIEEQLQKFNIETVDRSFSHDSYLYDGAISSLEEFATHFPAKNDIERELLEFGLIRDRDYTDRCGNCHAYMDASDKYCKFCGTRRGEGKFLPFYNPMMAVYGPPIRKKYQCGSCGHKWITSALGGGKDSLYCPQCGIKQVSLLEEKMFDFGDPMDAE